jgi:GT2 family glycosyltransferase
MVEEASFKIAVLMACYNRREKTLAGLNALYRSALPRLTCFDVVLVDDGCTDGTTEAVLAGYPAVKVLPSAGGLFWNRSMHLAFDWALARSYDAFLWLNDDTVLRPDALAGLIATSQSLRARLGKAAIVVGTTVDSESGRPTYGGHRRVNALKPVTFALIAPGDEPVECVAMNGNCVLIPREVAMAVGNIDPSFEHAMGDTDYALRARNAGFTVWLAPGVAGTCSHNPVDGTFTDARLPRKVRWKVMLGPKGLPLRSWYVFTRRHAGPMWPLFWLWPYAKLVATSLLPRRS